MGVGAVTHGAVHASVLRMALIDVACGAMTGFSHVVPYIPLGCIRFSNIVHRTVANKAWHRGVRSMESSVEIRAVIVGIKAQRSQYIGAVQSRFV